MPDVILTSPSWQLLDLSQNPPNLPHIYCHPFRLLGILFFAFPFLTFSITALVVQILSITQPFNVSLLFLQLLILFRHILIIYTPFLGILQPNPLSSWLVTFHFPSNPPFLAISQLYPILILVLQVSQISFQHSSSITNILWAWYQPWWLLWRTNPLDSQFPPFSIQIPPFSTFSLTSIPNNHAHQSPNPSARNYRPHYHSF